jgi:hypothetical protein
MIVASTAGLASSDRRRCSKDVGGRTTTEKEMDR